MNQVDEALEIEIRDLMDRGFECAWISDIRVGDIFAGPRLFSFDAPRKLMVCERIHKHKTTHYDIDNDGFEENRVICMIITDEDGLQRELSYGNTNEVYIYRGQI